MQRFLFARVEVWLVLLLALLGAAGAVLLSALVLETERGASRLRPVGEAAVGLAEVPRNLQRMLSPDRMMVAPLGAREGTGWAEGPAAEGLDGYLLLSRYDGDIARHVVELRSLPDGDVRHVWRPDADALLGDVPRTSELVDYTHWTNRYSRVIHPFLDADGSLVIKPQLGPLLRLDACGALIWRQTEHLFHHSTESDGADGFWVPAYIDPSTIEDIGEGFREDALVHVAADGTVTSRRSLVGILADNGHFPMLFTDGDYSPDPTHLNDIQPVLEDGPHWRAGDLFLSLRHLSLVMLYRPSTDEIVWMRQGPWIAQHDVDILDDHTIGIFSNNAYDKGRGGRVLGTSEVFTYDFATDTTSSPYRAAMERNDVVTLVEGLWSLLPGGQVMVEEENAGRILMMTPEGEIAADFVNRASDGQVYRLGWSRFIDRASGEAALGSLEDAACGPER